MYKILLDIVWHYMRNLANNQRSAMIIINNNNIIKGRG